MAKCTFCSNELAMGHGKMIVEADGTANFFCCTKCERNARIRQPRRVAWTAAGKKEKESRLAMLKQTGAKVSAAAKVSPAAKAEKAEKKSKTR